MKADGFIDEVIVYRNMDKHKHKPFKVVLADKNPGDAIPTFEYVETIRINPHETIIDVYDLDRPVYYRLPDGTKRKIYYHKKKVQSSKPKVKKE